MKRRLPANAPLNPPVDGCKPPTNTSSNNSSGLHVPSHLQQQHDHHNSLNNNQHSSLHHHQPPAAHQHQSNSNGPGRLISPQSTLLQNILQARGDRLNSANENIPPAHCNSSSSSNSNGSPNHVHTNGNGSTTTTSPLPPSPADSGVSDVDSYYSLNDEQHQYGYFYHRSNSSCEYFVNTIL